MNSLWADEPMDTYPLALPIQKGQKMAARTKKAPAFAPEEVQKALEILESIGQRDGYSWESVVALLPEGLRPRADHEGNVFVTISETNDDGYTATQTKKINAALRAAWLPVDIDLGKAGGVITISLRDSYGESLEWL